MSKHFIYPVRWVGTNYPGANRNFQSVNSYDDIKRSLYWELFTCTRQRAFAYTLKDGDIGNSWIGLLVDITRSQIDVIFKDDCYSLRDNASNQLVARRYVDYSYRHESEDLKGEQVLMGITRPHSSKDKRVAIKPHLTQSHNRLGYSSYREALGYLKFSGIVVKRNIYRRYGESNQIQEKINLAKEWAIEFDIPYLGKIGDFKPSRYFGL